MRLQFGGYRTIDATPLELAPQFTPTVARQPAPLYIRNVMPVLQRTHIPLFLVLICFFWTSFYGLNFGAHWDEARAKLDSVRDSVNTGWFIQGASGESNGM